MNGQLTVIIGITISLMLLLLLGFGLAYNTLVNRWGERKEGYVGLLVVGGVGFTCLAAGLLDWLLSLAGVHWNALLIDMVCFAASGMPMLIGDISRHDRAHHAAQVQARAHAEALATKAIEAVDDQT